VTIIDSTDIRTASIIHLESIGSTNDEALKVSRIGEPGPLWLRADRQTQGRGRQGRLWSSPEGNLYVSLLMPLNSEGRFLPQLAHVAAVALVRAICASVGSLPALCIKWPNDVLIAQAKVAGILIETTTTPQRRQACVIGWGVNCAFHPEGLPYPTTDLSAASGQAVSPDAVFSALVPAMAEALALWNRGHGFLAIRDAWLRSALPVGTTLTARLAQGPTTGRFQGMDAAGRLLLLGPDGLITIEAGDIILGDRSAASVG
jgi:BirA family biotin operon repressor/biotin-[acetyl-CoA-carboxylase] ligase